MKFYFKYILISFFIILIACDDSKRDMPEENEKNEVQNVDTSDYVHTVLPSLLGYLYELHGGIGNIISYELKTDSKSTFVALVYQLPNEKIQSVNFHFKGNYNGSELSLNHPFMFLCECDQLCKDCRFQTNQEGQVMCGCNDKSVDSPCDLTMDHITDFDFYANYHEMGKELIKEFNLK